MIAVTGGQILAHFVGDYLLQSRWMAEGKLQRWPQALAHGAFYALPFGFLTQSWWQLALIDITHAVFDRFSLSWYVMWLRDCLAPRSGWPKWSEFGAPPQHEWLRIVVDNICHVLINAVILAL